MKKLEKLIIIEEPEPEKSGYDEVVDTAKGLMECPVCLEFMGDGRHIWMCAAEHLVCEVCKEQLHNYLCPICRTERVIMRAYFAEKMAGIIDDVVEGH